MRKSQTSVPVVLRNRPHPASIGGSDIGEDRRSPGRRPIRIPRRSLSQQCGACAKLRSRCACDPDEGLARGPRARSRLRWRPRHFQCRTDAGDRRLRPRAGNACPRGARQRSGARRDHAAGAVESLPFEDGSFDVVLSRFSAHHGATSTPACARTAGPAKAGGMVAMGTPASSGIPLTTTISRRSSSSCATVPMSATIGAEWEAAIARAGRFPVR